MKTFHFILLALFFAYLFPACTKLADEAQVTAEVRTVTSTDKNWYVKAGCGISGYDQSQNPLYANCGINSLVTINALDHPTSQNERKDIFAIFNDGTYINTRGNQTLFQGNGTSGYKVTFGGESPVKYLYMTEPYDDDDPTFIVTVNGNSSDNFPISLTSYQNTSAILSANHDCVNNEDITLIIDNSLFTNSSYSLQFNDTYLSPSTVFNGSYSFHNVGSYTEGSGVINNLNRNTSYQFINFKVQNITDAVLNTQLQFTLKAGNTTIATLGEYVRGVHDPNVLLLESKKRVANGYEYDLKLECFNDSEYGGVKNVSYKLNTAFDDKAAIEITDWSQGGESALSHPNKKPKVVSKDGYTFVNIIDGNRLCKATSTQYTFEDQKAWIRFKIISGKELKGSFINLLKPQVIFDGIAFNIKDYEDCEQIVN